MIRAGQIVAQRLGCPGSQEHRTGIFDLRQKRTGICGAYLQMLGGHLVGQLHTALQTGADNDCAKVLEGLLHDLTPA